MQRLRLTPRILALALLVLPVAARAEDPFSKMAKPQAPAPITPGTQRATQDLQRSVDEAQRDVQRRAREEQLLRSGSTADIERYRMEQEQALDAQRTLEDLDRQALERAGAPEKPSETQKLEQERARQEDALDKRRGVVEQKVRVRERRERETPLQPR